MNALLPGGNDETDSVGQLAPRCLSYRLCLDPSSRLRMRIPMQTPIDLNQSRIVLKQDSTLIGVIEMSLSSWLVAGIVPGVERQPLKKLAIDESALLKLRTTSPVIPREPTFERTLKAAASGHDRKSMQRGNFRPTAPAIDRAGPRQMVFDRHGGALELPVSRRT